MKPLAWLNILAYYDNVYTDEYTSQGNLRRGWRLFGRVPLSPSIFSLNDLYYALLGKDYEPRLFFRSLRNISDVSFIGSINATNKQVINPNVISDGDHIPDLYKPAYDVLPAVTYEGIPSNISPINIGLYFHAGDLDIFVKKSDGSYYSEAVHGNQLRYSDLNLLTLYMLSRSLYDSYGYPILIEQLVDEYVKEAPNFVGSGVFDWDYLSLDLNSIYNIPIYSNARKGSNFYTELVFDNEYDPGVYYPHGVFYGLELDFTLFDVGLGIKLSPGLIMFRSIIYHFGGSESSYVYIDSDDSVKHISVSGITPYDYFILRKGILALNSMDGGASDDVYIYKDPFFGDFVVSIPTYEKFEAPAGLPTITDFNEILVESEGKYSNDTCNVDGEDIYIYNDDSYDPSTERLYLNIVRFIEEPQLVSIYNPDIFHDDEVYLSIGAIDGLGNIGDSIVSDDINVEHIASYQDPLSFNPDLYWNVFLITHKDGIPLRVRLEPTSGTYYHPDGTTTDDYPLTSNEYGYIIFGSDGASITNLSAFTIKLEE